MLTRADLSPGAQATQSCHAAFQFAMEHPKLMEDWHRTSQFLCLLSVPDEESLMGWVLNLQDHDLVHSVFHEPDWDDQLTAVAVAPSETAQRIFANLPLTLRDAHQPRPELKWEVFKAEDGENAIRLVNA